MGENQFWDIIEAGGPAVLRDPRRQLTSIAKALRTLLPEEIIAFNNLFEQKMGEAYTWDLWGAAYLINGGCSDDGFCYFRAWLISRGRDIYAAAIHNPDSLAGVTDPSRDDYEFEDLWYVAQQVYRERTGHEAPPASVSSSPDPRGEDWDFDDVEECSRRLPRLSALYV